MDQCQNLSNYTINYPFSNPTLTWLVISGLLVVRGGVGGWLLRYWDWPKISLAFPLELVPADILNNNCFSCLNMHFLLPPSSLSLSLSLSLSYCQVTLFTELVNSFILRSDSHVTSSYNIHTLSSKQITRVFKLIISIHYPANR